MPDIEIPLQERDAFYQSVWKIVRQIPAGKVSSYGQIGGYIPCPDGVAAGDYQAFRARWVGNAMAASPADVPWQRVINAQGKISIHQAKTQRSLLEAEGIVFDERERVDLKRYGWQGPDPEWLRENGFIAPDQPQQLSLL